MKIKISYRDNCLTLGYIKKTNNLIIGWYIPDVMNISFINDTVTKRDFHITYPRDGNAHFSYKYFDPSSNFNFEKRVYFDEVVLKKFTKNMDFINFEKNPRNDNDLDQHLAIRSKPLPLDNNFKLFLFPLTANVVDERLFQKIIEVCNQSSEDDIVFDVENFEGRTLNIGFAIYTGNEEEFFWTIPNIIAQKKVKAFDNIYIESYLLIAD